MSALRLTHHTYETAKDMLEVATEIHTEIYNEPLFENQPFFSEVLFRQRYTMALTQPGFELLRASLDGTNIGYMYGYALRAEEGWWNNIDWAEDADAGRRDSYTSEDGSRTVVIPEILVRSRWRRLGVARSMHDQFLSGREEQRAGLRILPNNMPAKFAYRKWGWSTVGTVRPVTEAPLFECMIKQLH